VGVTSLIPKGRELIKLYYQWSPVIVREMEADEDFKEDIKEMVGGFLGMVEKSRVNITNETVEKVQICSFVNFKLSKIKWLQS
jgi:hypothetical protein